MARGIPCLLLIPPPLPLTPLTLPTPKPRHGALQKHAESTQDFGIRRCWSGSLGPTVYAMPSRASHHLKTTQGSSCKP